MYDKVLVPVSRSQWEDAVVKHAVEHALQHDSEIHAVHVVAEEILEKMEGNESSQPDDATSATSREVLDDVEEQIPDDVVLNCEELSGSPSTAILRYAKENDIDLIVMGTHGRSGVQRYLLGSVAEEVVRNSDCAVLTVGLEKPS